MNSLLQPIGPFVWHVRRQLPLIQPSRHAHVAVKVLPVRYILVSDQPNAVLRTDTPCHPCSWPRRVGESVIRKRMPRLCYQCNSRHGKGYLRTVSRSNHADCGIDGWIVCLQLSNWLYVFRGTFTFKQKSAFLSHGPVCIGWTSVPINGPL